MKYVKNPQTCQFSFLNIQLYYLKFSFSFQPTPYKILNRTDWFKSDTPVFKLDEISGSNCMTNLMVETAC